MRYKFWSFYSIMPKNKRLRHGVGAKISVYKKFLHPRALVAAKYPNAGKTDVLHGLLAIRQEEKMVSKKMQSCIVMRHNDFDDGQLLHAVTRYCKVEEEGPLASLFNDILQDAPEGGIDVACTGEENVPTEIPANSGDDDASKFRALGFCVDDDNEPAEENIPTPAATLSECTYHEWNSFPLCRRRLVGATDVQPTLIGAEPTMCSVVGFFLHFLPVTYFKSVVLPATNAKLNDPLTWEEFVRFLGLIFLMATSQGSQRRDYWATDSPQMFSGAPFRLHQYMSRRRFENILKHLAFTQEPPPAFKDPFHQVNDLIGHFNSHTHSAFSPGWVSCLDESMSVWSNRWTCPGWMFVPRKPHPMGNEYHSVCCGLSGIMYSIELVEGKDRPKELPKKKHHEKGNTTALLLRLTESIAHSGRVVIMDSGFCVLKALIELYNQGIFGSAVIKKRRFWPKYIDGDGIDKRFEDRNVGTVEDHPGMLGGVPFKVFVLKEEDYSMKLMATYGARTEVDGGVTQRSITTRSGEKATVTFKYMEPFFNHFKYRHQVDDHNNMRHSPISLEESLSTKDWKIRVFSFILAIVEVNARLAFCRWISTDKSVTQLEFRRLLAKELLELSFRVRGRPRQRLDAMVRSNCGEEMAPKYAGAWTGKEWKKLSTMYPQHVCKTLNCNRRIRT